MSSAAYLNGRRAECARLRMWAFGDGQKIPVDDTGNRYILTSTPTTKEGLKMVSFKVTPEERAAIKLIADRAQTELVISSETVSMDLSALIAQGCKLRLDELLTADAFNFAHDIYGIRRHINCSTGKLEHHFLPRFAA